MCWVEFKSRCKGLKTASKDIEVYKSVLNVPGRIIQKPEGYCCKSLFNHYIYERNQNNPEIWLRLVLVNHSMTNDPLKDMYIVNEGYHSYTSLAWLNYHNNSQHILAKFIIPKGSLYCINREGEVVSSKIIFKEIL